MSDLPPDDRTADSPDAPVRDWRDRAAASRFPGVLLDPGAEWSAGEDVHATVYVPDTLIVTPTEGNDTGTLIDALGGAAASLGWQVTEEPLFVPDRSQLEFAEPAPSGARSSVARIAISPDADPRQPVHRPDAWRLLQQARRVGITGFSLNHVLTTDSGVLDPFKGNPFKGNPFKGNPFKGNPAGGDSGGTAAYGLPGWGGRQPVSYIGPAPRRADMRGARRPLVAVLDTGCGIHAWLPRDDVLVDPVSRYGVSLGLVTSGTDPETYPSQGDPLDGVMDDASGHGTFIAGILRQACPEVEILPVRVADSQGVFEERTLLYVLGQIAKLVEKGTRIDVMNLSFGFYHESPDDAAHEGELYSLLSRIRAQRCVVVCSAGNDSTDRPAAPASLCAYPNGPISDESERGLAPQFSVGALNPSDRSVAMFSNVGPWVTAYAAGVSLFSTMPTGFDAGGQADLRHDLYRRRRETLDMDDFRGGFGVWSGTSFAAPLVAGRIAAGLVALIVAAGVRAVTAEDVDGVVAEVLDVLRKQDLSRLV